MPDCIKWRFTAVVAGLAVLSACAVGPDYRQPETRVPQQWQAAADSGEGDENQLAQWWLQFNDPVLNGLVNDALAANLDLHTAQAQLREARARRGLASGNLGPRVDVSASASRSKTGKADAGTFYNAGLDASWEADIFGGLRRGLEAADADLQAQQELLRDTRVSLVAEVARNYIDLRSNARRLAVAEASLAAQAETAELTQWRYQAGMVSEQDALQARTQLEQTRAGLPLLQGSIAASRHRLAILLGQQPGALDSRLQQADTVIPVVATQIAAGIPADTLRQRPDVRAAERRLAAQTARLGEAEAARYPALNLSGSLGWQATGTSGLGGSDSATRSLLAGISAPIFDAGRIRSQIAAQDAVLEQARLAYQSAILGALEEVENALVQLANSRERQRQLQQAVDSARASWQLTQHRYSAGLADFQAVLDSQRTLLGLEDSLASNSGDVSRAQVQLFMALGGGWQGAENAGDNPDNNETQKAANDNAVLQETL